MPRWAQISIGIGVQFADIGNNNNLESCIGSQPININKLERHITNITIYWLRPVFLVNAAVWGEKNTNVQQSHARQFWGAKSPPTRGLLPGQSSFGPFLKRHPPFAAGSGKAAFCGWGTPTGNKRCSPSITQSGTRNYHDPCFPC